MESTYYCKKRYISIDSNFEICKDCCKRKLSSFEDKEICIKNNLTFFFNLEEVVIL